MGASSWSRVCCEAAALPAEAGGGVDCCVQTGAAATSSAMAATAVRDVRDNGIVCSPACRTRFHRRRAGARRNCPNGQLVTALPNISRLSLEQLADDLGDLLRLERERRITHGELDHP